MLPAIAILHVRHAQVRQSGAILGTIAGTAMVTVGLGGSVNVDLQPAALVVLGIWWWSIGKTWAETAVLARPFGVATAALGALAVLAAFVAAFGVGIAAVRPGAPYVPIWTTHQLVVGAWLIALAVALWREPLTSPRPR